MKSQITAERIALLHPKYIPLITGFVNDTEEQTGLIWFCAQGLRTFAQQQAIYDQGRTTPGHIVTQAKAGQSYHNYGLSSDLLPFKEDGKTLDWYYGYSTILPIAAKYNLEWGGHFAQPDEDHFENRFGYNWRQLLAKYNAKDFIEGTTFLNL